MRNASIPLFEAGQAPHPIVFSLNGQIWRVFPDGSEAQPTGILVVEESLVIRVGGRFRHGSEAPVLSPDRQRLAFIEDGDLVIADLEQAEPNVAIDARRTEAIVINSWTPDGQNLMAYVENTHSHEGSYRQVDSRSLEVSDLPFIERIAAWTMNSASVLFDRTGQDNITLLSQSLEDGQSQVIARSSGRDAYHLLSAAQGRLAYMENRQLCVIPEGGGESEVVISAGDAGEIIRPELSPDGNSIAFLQQLEGETVQVRLAVIDLESRQIQVVASCGARCEFQWYNGQHLLYTDAQRRLFLVDVEGHQMLVARGAQLVGIGQPL